MSAEWCDLGDLPADQCACRIHATAEPPSEPLVIVARFLARFDSRCSYCDRTMHEGSPIAKTEDYDYICERCSR